MQRKETIRGFTGEYNFLSNAYPHTILVRGKPFRSIEAAFLASVYPPNLETAFENAVSRSEIRRLSHMGKPKNEYSDSETQLRLMETLLRQKFAIDGLAASLLATGDKRLEEVLPDRDLFWGTFLGKGKNHLGEILMKLRSELQSKILSGKASLWRLKETQY